MSRFDGAFVTIALLNLAISIAVIWVVVHFIVKFW